MAATQYPATTGTTITVGELPSFTGYITEKWEVSPAGNMDREDYKGNDGAFYATVIYEKRQELIDFELIPAGSSPGTGTEVVEGSMCSLTGYTAYEVLSCKKITARGATRYSGQIRKVTMA